MAVTAKECHALISYYEKQYVVKYGKVPSLNRYAARWGFDSVLQSMSAVEAKSLVDYYLTTPATRRHDLDWFFYHYHQLLENMKRSVDDNAHRRKLMEESKRRAEEWRQSGKQGYSND